MTDFYEDMRGVADELLGEFKQGSVQLKRITTTPGPNEWDPPIETVETWELSAAVRRVSTKYVDGTLIIASDNQVTFAVPATVPKMSHDTDEGTRITDTLVIDGVEHSLKDLRPLPGAGTVVAYIAFIAG